MPEILINNQSLHFFTSPHIGENMYVITKGNKALAVDPNSSAEAIDLLNKNNIEEVTIFLTHEHPDHTCGIPSLQKRFKTTLICQQECARQIAEKQNNRPILIAFILAVEDEKNGTQNEKNFIKNFEEYTCQADITFDGYFTYDWQGEHFVFQQTPGHSKGSCCIVWNEKAVFTGDSLLKDIPVITRFPGGNTKLYTTITKPYLDSLPEDMTVFPGHGRIFQMKEVREKAA